MSVAGGVVEECAGIGPGAIFSLLAGLTELGFLNRREVAALVGLAPLSRDRQVSKGFRLLGGRGNVRAALYMPTLVAIRVNTAPREFYERLLAKYREGNCVLKCELSVWRFRCEQ